MERRTLVIVIIAVIIIIGVGFIAILAKTPTVSVSGAAINSLNLTTIGLEFTLTVDSSYPFTIPIHELDYLVRTQSPGGTLLLAQGRPEGLSIRPGTQEIAIPVMISNPALIGTLMNVLRSGEIGLTFSGNITPDLIGIRPSIPFSKEVKVPVNTGDILSGVTSIAKKLLEP